MQGISIWIKIDEARLELNGENSIYGSRKAVGCFMINCDCIGNSKKKKGKGNFGDF